MSQKLKKQNSNTSILQQQQQREIRTQSLFTLSERKEKFCNNIRPKTAITPITTTITKRNISNYSVELPSLDFGNLSISCNERYFGDTSKSLYYDTYRQLKSRGEVLLGGFTELENIVQQNDQQNIFSQTVDSLETFGVLTPPITSRFFESTSTKKLLNNNSNLKNSHSKLFNSNIIGEINYNNDSKKKLIK